MAEEAGLQVDTAGFERSMGQQKEQSRRARKTGAAGALKFEAEATAYLANHSVPRTNDKPKYVQALSPFNISIEGMVAEGFKVGLCRYSEAEVQTRVAAIMTSDGFAESTAGLEQDATVGIVLDSTPFYAEQGGQVADTGRLTSSSGAQLDVQDTQVRHSLPGEGWSSLILR